MPTSSYPVPTNEQNESDDQTSLTNFPLKINPNNSSEENITSTTEGQMTSTSLLQVDVSQTKVDSSNTPPITQSQNMASEKTETKDELAVNTANIVAVTYQTASQSDPPDALLPVSNNDGVPSCQTSETLNTKMLALSQLALYSLSQENTLLLNLKSSKIQSTNSEGNILDETSSAQFPASRAKAGSGKLKLSDAVRATELFSTTGLQEYTSKIRSVTPGEEPKNTYNSADTTQEHSDFSTSLTSLSSNPTSNSQGSLVMEASREAQVIPKRSLGIALGSSAAAMFIFVSIMFFHHSCTRLFQSARNVNPLDRHSPKGRNRDTQRAQPEISRFSADTR